MKNVNRKKIENRSLTSVYRRKWGFCLCQYAKFWSDKLHQKLYIPIKAANRRRKKSRKCWEKERQRQTDRHTQTDRQRMRQRERDKERERLFFHFSTWSPWINWWTNRPRDGLTDRWTKPLIDSTTKRVRCFAASIHNHHLGQFEV